MKECEFCYNIHFTSLMIKCNQCKCEFCRLCFLSFFRQTSFINPSCLKCDYKFTPLFVKKNLRPKEYNNYITIITQKYLVLEDKHFPEIMSIIENEQKFDIFNEIVNLFENYKKKKQTFIYKNNNDLKLIEKINKNYTNVIIDHILYSNIRDLYKNISTFNLKLILYCFQHSKIVKGYKLLKKYNKESQFIISIKCEYCNNFLNKNLYCIYCKITLCKKCLIIEKDNHICDKSNRLNVKTILDTCKQCPNCNQIIFKIDGCDQMWCVRCKMAFSWKNLTIETGNIHNPHYQQWLITNGEHINNFQNIDVSKLENIILNSNLFLKFKNLLIMSINFIFEIHIKLSSDVDIGISFISDNNIFSINNVRKKFITEKINKRKYISQLQRFYNKQSYDEEIKKHLNNFIKVGIDLINIVLESKSITCKEFICFASSIFKLENTIKNTVKEYLFNYLLKDTETRNLFLFANKLSCVCGNQLIICNMKCCPE